jgi:hypothetical protein
VPDSASVLTPFGIRLFTVANSSRSTALSAVVPVHPQNLSMMRHCAGLHTLQAEYPLAFASFSETGILLLDRYRQVAV